MYQLGSHTIARLEEVRTVEDLVTHDAEVFEEPGFKHLADPGALSTWMTEGTTGWPAILAEQPSS